VPRTCTVCRHEPRSRPGGCACPSLAVPILACPNETLVKCDVEQVEAGKAWLEKALVLDDAALLSKAGAKDV